MAVAEAHSHSEWLSGIVDGYQHGGEIGFRFPNVDVKGGKHDEEVNCTERKTFNQSAHVWRNPGWLPSIPRAALGRALLSVRDLPSTGSGTGPACADRLAPSTGSTPS